MTLKFHDNLSTARHAFYVFKNKESSYGTSGDSDEVLLNKIKNYRSETGDTLLYFFSKDHSWKLEMERLIKMWPESLTLENNEGKTVLANLFKEANRNWDLWMIIKRVELGVLFLDKYLQPEFKPFIPKDIFFESSSNPCEKLKSIWEKDLGMLSPQTRNNEFFEKEMSQLFISLDVVETKFRLERVSSLSKKLSHTSPKARL